MASSGGPDKGQTHLGETAPRAPSNTASTFTWRPQDQHQSCGVFTSSPREATAECPVGRPLHRTRNISQSHSVAAAAGDWTPTATGKAEDDATKQPASRAPCGPRVNRQLHVHIPPLPAGVAGEAASHPARTGKASTHTHTHTPHTQPQSSPVGPASSAHQELTCLAWYSHLGWLLLSLAPTQTRQAQSFPRQKSGDAFLLNHVPTSKRPSSHGSFPP